MRRDPLEDLNFNEPVSDEAVPVDSVDDPYLEDLTPAEQEVWKKVQERQAAIDPIMTGFQELQARPSDEDIEAWKKQFGKVYIIGLNEDYYVFRPLRRMEWRTLMKKLSTQQDEMKRKEEVCRVATLWPDSDQNILAGTPDTLYEMVLQASNFLLPQDAIACVRKL